MNRRFLVLLSTGLTLNQATLSSLRGESNVRPTSVRQSVQSMEKTLKKLDADIAQAKLQQISHRQEARLGGLPQAAAIQKVLKPK